MNSVAGNVTVDKKKSVAGMHPKGLTTVGEEGMFRKLKYD